MIKAILIGLQQTDSQIQIIQRGGKRFVLALAIEIATTADQIDSIDATTAVSFSLEEVPLSAARKLLAEMDGDAGAIVAMQDGKSLSGDDLEALKTYVRRHVKALPVATIKSE
ncbi:hypothetical protein [Neorhizobium alkalisoli]|uniref:Uncharacterized protein n=1 Tax=Neorhizobium alkalisoli TaxID=528178 RepID=A0A561R182_9HYPH|nr:hypothetical protein [Neorhizobium alkalisoli]TWF56378.1 hypothetical protein FHW37_1024 [Neorhizobium alkalisoli]